MNSFEAREELISTLVNALNWNEGSDTNIISRTFMDSYSISEVNRSNIALAIEKKLINGYEDGSFKGFNGITRAEACKLIQNAQLLGGRSIISYDFIENNGNEKEVIESDEIETEKTPTQETQTKETQTQEIKTPKPAYTTDITVEPVQDIIIPNVNPNNNPDLRKKRLEYIFGYNQYGEIAFYTEEEEAKENIEEVNIAVWDIDKNSNKYTKNMKIYVNEKIADEVRMIFNLIYNDKEKFPIKYIASYAWRKPMSSGRLSEHNYGTCLDINPTENPYIVNGETIVGEKWEPGKNPYSVGTNSSVMRVFREYKWGWGGSDWSGTTKDYMHFTYMGH